MKKLLAKLCLLAVAATVLQLVLVPRLRKMKDVRRLNDAVAAAPDVLFFCDSVNAWIDGEDEDRRGISTMIEDLLTDVRVGTVTRGAYHAEVFEAFVDLLIERGDAPRTLLIPINLRSFSPEWDAKPAYQFEVAKRQIRHADHPFELAVDPLLRTLHLRDEASVTQLQYKQTPVHRGAQVVGTVADFDNPSYAEVTPERTRNKLIFHYMSPLTAGHRKVAALRRIATKTRAAGLRAVFYVTPIDVETGERFLPGEFRAQVKANVSVLLATLADHVPPVLDLSQAVPAAHFSYESYPNEHLREEGRLRVARELAELFARELGMERRAVEAGTGER